MKSYNYKSPSRDPIWPWLVALLVLWMVGGALTEQIANWLLN